LKTKITTSLMQWNDEALHTYLSLQLAINSQIDEMHLVSLDNYMNSETPKNGDHKCNNKNKGNFHMIFYLKQSKDNQNRR